MEEKLPSNLDCNILQCYASIILDLNNNLLYHEHKKDFDKEFEIYKIKFEEVKDIFEKMSDSELKLEKLREYRNNTLKH